MVVYRQLSSNRLDDVFGALADATRRDILTRVLAEDASVSALAARYDMSFAAVQKHVAVLERAQLVTKHRVGREQRVTGNADTVRRAFQLLGTLEQHWRARVDQLDRLLAATHEGAPHADRRDSQGPASPDHDRHRPVRRSGHSRLGRLR